MPQIGNKACSKFRMSLYKHRVHIAVKCILTLLHDHNMHDQHALYYVMYLTSRTMASITA